MKKIFAVLALLAVGAVTAVAQDAPPERSKTGAVLTKALNGADVYVLTVRYHLDGGASPAVCGTVGYGRNMMVWCDGAAYVSNQTTALDGGVIGIEEMVPVTARSPYPFGLTGVAGTKNQVCVLQNENQSDAGPVVRCHFSRRY